MARTTQDPRRSTGHDDPRVDRDAITVSTHSEEATPPGLAPTGRAQAPIKWPRPDRVALVAGALWVVGLLIGLLVPALIAPPGARNDEDVATVWTAFTFSAIGAFIMIGSMFWVYLKKKDAAALILGLVPGMSIIIGGIIFATTKLTITKG